MDELRFLSKQSRPWPLRRTAWCIAVLSCLSFCVAGWDGLPAEGPCTCPLNQVNGGWCPVCKVGSIAGFRIESEMLFEALDAHGHDIDPDRIQCPSCRKALETDAYCDTCRMGFVGKKAYLSRLTYHLARGLPTVKEKIECATCRRNADKHGWCAACQVGMVGNVAVKDRADYENGARALDLLLSALPLLARCESCAVAKVTGGRCPACDVRHAKEKKAE